jgi:DNA-binding HxlR family transcriptional regulator
MPRRSSRRPTERERRHPAGLAVQLHEQVHVQVRNSPADQRQLPDAADPRPPDPLIRPPAYCCAPSTSSPVIAGMYVTVVSPLARLDRGGPATSSELVRQEQISPHSISATLSGFETRGLIGRQPDPDDRRRLPFRNYSDIIPRKNDDVPAKAVQESPLLRFSRPRRNDSDSYLTCQRQ